jgi:hypothetical protein
MQLSAFDRKTRRKKSRASVCTVPLNYLNFVNSLLQVTEYSTVFCPKPVFSLFNTPPPSPHPFRTVSCLYFPLLRTLTFLLSLFSVSFVFLSFYFALAPFFCSLTYNYYIFVPKSHRAIPPSPARGSGLGNFRL